MKHLLRYLTLFLLYLCLTSCLRAQDAPFSEEIAAFKKADSVHFPPTNAILFIGSSSFRKWEDVQEYFPKYTIINRGFGGSSLPDVIRYADDIIFPYNPKQIVIYCGENDLASSDTVTGNTVYSRFVTLFDLIRNRLPDVSIAFVSMKPSPSRTHLFDKMVNGNSMIRDFLKSRKNAEYIDVYSRMLNKDGTPMQDIFLEDNLHMNVKGYAIWKKEFLPYLIKK